MPALGYPRASLMACEAPCGSVLPRAGVPSPDQGEPRHPGNRGGRHPALGSRPLFSARGIIPRAHRCRGVYAVQVTSTPFVRLNSEPQLEEAGSRYQFW